MRKKKIKKRKKSSSICFMFVTFSSYFLLSRPNNTPHSTILYYNFQCNHVDNASKTLGFTKGIENSKNLGERIGNPIMTRKKGIHFYCSNDGAEMWNGREAYLSIPIEKKNLDSLLKIVLCEFSKILLLFVYMSFSCNL